MLQSDFDCHDFLSRLVTPDRWEESSGDVPTATAEDIKQQLSNSYDIVDIHQARFHPSLVALGISPKFLELAVSGFKSFSDFFLKWAGPRLDRPLPEDVSPRVADALITLKTKKKYSFSPWTGTALPTHDCLGPNWYLFGHPGSGFLAGQLSALTFQTHDTVWIVPALKKIFFVYAGMDDSEVLGSCVQMIVHLTKRIDEVFRYLKSEERKVVIYDFHCEHFGHYVWNVISAWGALFELAPPDQIGEIVCANSDRFFGAITDIFRSHAHGVTEKQIRSVDEVYDQVFRESSLLCSIHGIYISEFTAQSVVRHCMSRCEPSFNKRLLALRREHWPVVLLSLRLDNRSWVDQIEGFAEMATRLRRDFPNVGFVIHGISKGVAMGWSTAWMSLEAEIQAAAELESVLGEPRDVVNAVGLSIHESVAISNLCDAFVAPVGSGMAVYKWLTNKPGVAFSNEFCLNAANSDRWVFFVFDRARSNVIPATYIPLSAVSDVDLARGTPSRANFTLDRSVLYLAMRNLLLSLRNLALRKPALQSSVSPCSSGRTLVEDAKGGNNGNLCCHYGMHTATEADPWWQVDLEDSLLVQQVVIFNRWEQAERLKHFTILGSLDGKQWRVLFRKTDDEVFGQRGDPFTAEIADGSATRFLRVRLDGRAPLHFRECQVFGIPTNPKRRAQMKRVELRLKKRRDYVRPDRQGYPVEIGGFAVFVDDKTYDQSIIDALKRGDYEGDLRQLVSQLVTQGDRVIELGTGIGIVAMTAARMAGAENVLTLDANADIVNDARDNFQRNDLECIGSQIGVLRHRRAIKDPHEMLPFYIDQVFWASRPTLPTGEHNIVKTVQVPILCLENAIQKHHATVLICDMAGGDAELLTHVDLPGIRLIIVSRHCDSREEAPTNEMVRQLMLRGFSLHLGLSKQNVLVLRRSRIRPFSASAK